MDSGGPRLKNRLRIDPNASSYVFAFGTNVTFRLSGLLGNGSSSADEPAGASQSQRGHAGACG